MNYVPLAFSVACLAGAVAIVFAAPAAAVHGSASDQITSSHSRTSACESNRNQGCGPGARTTVTPDGDRAALR